MAMSMAGVLELVKSDQPDAGQEHRSEIEGQGFCARIEVAQEQGQRQRQFEAELATVAWRRLSRLRSIGAATLPGIVAIWMLSPSSRML